MKDLKQLIMEKAKEKHVELVQSNSYYGNINFLSGYALAIKDLASILDQLPEPEKQPEGHNFYRQQIGEWQEPLCDICKNQMHEGNCPTCYLNEPEKQEYKSDNALRADGTGQLGELEKPLPVSRIVSEPEKQPEVKGESDSLVEKHFKEFWEDIIIKDGVVDLEQVKKELSDFSEMMDRFQKVINIFGGTMGISKLTYTDEVYAQALNEYVEQSIKDALEEKQSEQPDITAAEESEIFLTEFIEFIGAHYLQDENITYRRIEELSEKFLKEQKDNK